VPATFVGHPLFDYLEPRPDPMPDLIQAWADGSWNVALLPGSRSREIRNHGQALLVTARAVCRRWPRATCRFTVGNEEDAHAVRKACKWKRGQSDQIEIVIGKTSSVLADSHFAVAVSGTVTLEVAHYGLPMVIFYKVGKLGWDAVGRWLVRTPYLSLVNILSHRAIVPELMPWHGRPQRVRDMTLEVMEDLGYLVEARRRLLEMVENLRAAPHRSAAENTADVVMRVMQRQSVTSAAASVAEPL
jgi:lipid-A-disaccharide synthase